MYAQHHNTHRGLRPSEVLQCHVWINSHFRGTNEGQLIHPKLICSQGFKRQTILYICPNTMILGYNHNVVWSDPPWGLPLWSHRWHHSLDYFSYWRYDVYVFIFVNQSGTTIHAKHGGYIPLFVYLLLYNYGIFRNICRKQISILMPSINNRLLYTKTISDILIVSETIYIHIYINQQS